MWLLSLASFSPQAVHFVGLSLCDLISGIFFCFFSLISSFVLLVSITLPDSIITCTYSISLILGILCHRHYCRRLSKAPLPKIKSFWIIYQRYSFFFLIYLYIFNTKNILYCGITFSQVLYFHNKLWKIIKEMGISDYLTCLLRNQYTGPEATVRTRHGTTDLKHQLNQDCWEKYQ